ncbi:YbaB/EbfC family nucleoid-associated protein [Nocardia vermiculata]|uniref:YbaB/EbfC family nucleoid-associated protein n=1 Tax=Nocardia vermiculata TaxID=257274 RepID=A0A846Y334_9NOCA|nr:YbaB/EbfC family nucleoid-associated protein [Nocardia vermiculata]NKY51688.1 YbaB/EbfC family nucleoid-associated protein [Nocardia vermiculata]
MGTGNLDPMQENTRSLVQALTTARSSARSSDGLLAVEACADGEIEIRIDDRALVYGGAAVAAELSRLAAQALTSARSQVSTAMEAFQADPRITAAIQATSDAMDQPLTTTAPPPLPVSHDTRPSTHPATDPFVRTNDSRSINRQTPTAHQALPPYDLYDDDVDQDSYYQRKSWLV